jgi:hypothetical protein
MSSKKIIASLYPINFRLLLPTTAVNPMKVNHEERILQERKENVVITSLANL